MARGILRSLKLARKAVMAEISGNAAKGNLYARGLANEGFAGGYLAALDDVQAMLTHGYPNDRRGYWRAALHQPGEGVDD